MQPQTLQVLFQIISSAFCVIVVVSNIISAKMFQVPFMGGFSIPAGLITYPITFLISDLITEVYGAGKAKQMVYTALGLTLFSYAIIQVALQLPAADSFNQQQFHSVLGLNGIIIFSSLVAYVLAQIVDIQLYAAIKEWTGDRFLWLRNNGSTLCSQIIDTLTVNVIFLYWGLGMDWNAVVEVMLFSYLYKAVFSIANTPLFYFLVYLFKGKGKVHRMLNFTS